MKLTDILISPLKKIPVVGGNVLHVMKDNDNGYSSFGEAYFSLVNYRAIKAWKLHIDMTMNIVVPVGEARFVFVDESGSIREEQIGESHYARLTIPPGIWFGFKGV